MLSALKKHIKYIVPSLAFISLLIIHQYIYLMGDDFYYYTFTKSSILDFCKNHIEHYLHTNGRAIIHFLTSLFLVFNVYLWRFINPLLIMVTLFFIYKVATQQNKDNELFIIVILIFFSFGINVTSYAVYWLTGSFNYLFPVFLLFLSYYLYQKMLKNPQSKKVLYYFILFVSGATMEQSGLMLLGLIFLESFNHVFILKNKLNKLRVLSLIMVFLGYLTVIFSFGTFERFKYSGINGDLNQLINNIVFIIRLFFFDKTMVCIHIILILSCYFWLKQKKEKFDNILCFACIGLLAIYIFITNFNFPHIDKLLSVVFVIIYPFILLYTYINIFLTEKSNITDLSFIIVAFGGQLMLLVSNVLGGRTLFVSLMCLLVPTSKSLKKYQEKHIIFITLILWCFTYINIYKLLLSIPFLIYKIKKKNLKLDLIFFLIFSFITFFNVFNKYRENAVIHDYNVKVIEVAKINMDDEITLKTMKNDEYGVSFIYNSPYHVKWFKNYYEIPDNVTIAYED